MKKIMILFAAVLCISAVRAEGRPITADRLPQAARQFVKEYFPTQKMAYAKVDSGMFDTEYEVAFENGSKVEFFKNGEWKEVDCKNSAVPAGIVPSKIASYVKSNYPDAAIVQIERSRREWEVKLSNRWELTFDNSFNLIDIDD